MQRLSCAKFLIAASVALGALGAASVAQARTDVHLSIGVPFGHVQPAPIYTPAPVYHQPRPVYHQPRPVYVQPAPVYVYPSAHRGPGRGGAWGDADRDGIPNIHDRRFDGRHGHHHRGMRDSDRDGVPNRYDRAPHNPHRR